MHSVGRDITALFIEKSIDDSIPGYLLVVYDIPLLSKLNSYFKEVNLLITQAILMQAYLNDCM